MAGRKVVTLSAIALMLLTGCVDSAALPTPPAEDIGDGGECSDGQLVTIDSDEASISLTGDCGTVIVMSESTTVNVASAAQVIVRGDESVVLGDNWNSLIVDADRVVINTEVIGTVVIRGDNTRVNNENITELRLTGNQTTMSTQTIGVIVLHGNSSTIVCSGAVDVIDVYGTGNTITWQGGATGPRVDEGNNTLVP